MYNLSCIIIYYITGNHYTDTIVFVNNDGLMFETSDVECCFLFLTNIINEINCLNTLNKGFGEFF